MSEAIERILELGFLGAISEDDLESLRPAPTLLSVKTGETLLWQGEQGQVYYLLLRGRLRRFIETDFGVRRFLGDVVPGQGVGASGLLTEGGNAATVRVMHNSEVVRFSRSAFLQLMVLSWEFAIGVTREQIERVRAAAAPEARHATIKSIAVLPLDQNIDQRQFIDRLSHDIAAMASVTAIDRSVLDDPAGDGADLPNVEPSSSPASIDTDIVVNRLDAIERANDIVLYQIGAQVDDWSRLIFGRADLVLLVTTVQGPSQLCETETVLIASTEQELLPRIDLVLLHDEEWQPDCGTRKWLDLREIDEWHHVRRDKPQDFQRLARVLTGNAITLVLGGGGARGTAEIGVIQALRRIGIPIDRVAGTSMGALVGALYALGLDPDAMTEGIRTWATRGRAGKDLTFPAVSLVHGKRLHEETHLLLGDGTVEDLPVPFFCVSADISENKTVVHDRGLLWRAVRASMSVPGVGPPLFDDGRVLVDGGIVNNVPAEAVANRHAGRIIVVDVSIEKRLTMPRRYNDLVPSGWQVLWHRFNPFLEPLNVPSIFEVLERAGTLGSFERDRKARELADIAIYPPVAGVSITNFTTMDKLISDACSHALAQLYAIGGDELREMFKGVDSIQIGEKPRSTPPIDRAQFNEILGVDDDETFQEMMGLFVEMFPPEIDALQLAVEENEVPTVRELAHRAKSAAANVAAPKVRALLQDIEDRAKRGNVTEIPNYIDQVRTEFQRIKELYQAMSNNAAMVDRR